MESAAYTAGRQAFFTGYSAHDVTKFYAEGSEEARDWLAGLRAARTTADVTCVPPILLVPKPKIQVPVVVDPIWYRDDWHCLFLIREGGNLIHPKDRVAFIEKNPRIRIRPYEYRYPGTDPLANDLIVDELNWAESHSRPEDPKKWCVDMLYMLGYIFKS